MAALEKGITANGTGYRGKTWNILGQIYFPKAVTDSTFAFACNTHGQPTVAQQCAVTFIHAVRAGDVLTAHAVERSRVGRGGIYDVTVRDHTGKVVAEFRGHSRTIARRPSGDAARA